MSKLTVVATLRALPGKEEELERRLKALIGPTREEAGCLDYDLHRQVDDASVFVMVERWVDKGELDKHLQMPYLREFGAALPDLLRSPLEMQLLELRGTAAGA